MTCTASLSKTVLDNTYSINSNTHNTNDNNGTTSQPHVDLKALCQNLLEIWQGLNEMAGCIIGPDNCGNAIATNKYTACH